MKKIKVYRNHASDYRTITYISSASNNIIISCFENDKSISIDFNSLQQKEPSSMLEFDCDAILGFINIGNGKI